MVEKHTYDSGSAVERDVFPWPRLPDVPALGTEQRDVRKILGSRGI